MSNEKALAAAQAKLERLSVILGCLPEDVWNLEEVAKGHMASHQRMIDQLRETRVTLRAPSIAEIPETATEVMSELALCQATLTRFSSQAKKVVKKTFRP